MIITFLNHISLKSMTETAYAKEFSPAWLGRLPWYTYSRVVFVCRISVVEGIRCFQVSMGLGKSLL